MTDDAELLASAYLDDVVDADERADVESDPALLAEVERLQSVREQLATTEPAAISVRENHLASALSAWDRLPDAERLGTRDDTGGGDATTVAAASAMSAAPAGRPRRHWLIGAAAALVVVLGAGVVLQQIDPTDNDGTVAEPAAGAGADDGEGAVTEEATADADADGSAGEAVEEGELGRSEPAEELAAADIEAESEAIEAIEEEGGSTDELAHSADTPDQGPPPDAQEYPVLTSQQDLISYASLALGVTGTTVDLEVPVEQSESSPSTALPECDGLGVDVLVGPALYFDQVVMVGLDRDTGSAIAYDLTDCALVDSLPIPD